GSGTRSPLAAGLGRQPASPGQGQWCLQTAQRRRNSLLVNGQGGVAAILDQPFELDPDLAGRAGLEADAVGAPLGVTLRERGPGQVSRSLAARGHQIAPSVSVV